MTMQLDAPIAAVSDIPAAPRQAGPALLLLLATEGLTEEWSLLAAATLVVGEVVAGSEIDALVSAGVVRRQHGTVVLSDGGTLARVLESAPQTAVRDAHAAWARVLAGDPVSRARHDALALMVPGPAASHSAGPVTPSPPSRASSS
ncbi:hypothetical protein [Nocardioides sp. HB32]